MKEEKRIALYGGSFDPVHDGHLAVARSLAALFKLDEVLFIPAHVAPHKRAVAQPASPWHRHAMLALATQSEDRFRISTVELEAPERPYTVETLTRLREQFGANARLFFVMGADSWTEITTWRDWEHVLGICDHIVVTRPGYELSLEHVTSNIRARVADLRGAKRERVSRALAESGPKIFFNDAVKKNISSTEVRRAVGCASAESLARLPVPNAVAEYIAKYGLYRDQA